MVGAFFLNHSVHLILLSVNNGNNDNANNNLVKRFSFSIIWVKLYKIICNGLLQSQ